MLRGSFDSVLNNGGPNYPGKILPYELEALYTGDPEVSVETIFVPLTAQGQPITYENDLG